MKNPPHPGLLVKHDCLDTLGLTVTAAAKLLGVTRQTLNDLVHGRRGISPEMAIRLDLAFGGGADTWLRMQTTYDLAKARLIAKDRIKVKRALKLKGALESRDPIASGDAGDPRVLEMMIADTDVLIDLLQGKGSTAERIALGD